MKTHDRYRLRITSLSPVHIGTGDSYEPTNYVIDDGLLYEFDTGSALSAFSAADRADLLKIAGGRPDTDMIKKLQSFFYGRREALKAFAVNRVPVLSGVASLYASRVGQTAQREGDGGQVLNRLEIDRTAYHPFERKPVLFGSSLKGAIRTALLDKENQGQRAREKKGLHEFQGRLFHYRDAERGRLKLELDPLRLVQVADAAWKSDDDLPAGQVHLAVNRKKAPVVDEKGQLRKAMGENLYQILECVPAWRYRAFAGQIDVQRLDGARQAQDLPELRYSMQDIARACNRFYLPVLTGERKLLQEREFLDTDWNETVKRTLNAIKDKIARDEAFLLRVGRHSGAESVTVSGARNGNIRIMKGRGQPPEYADSPKTLWLAADSKDQRTGLLPFGWLLVEVEPLEAPAQDWPELQALCEPHLRQAKALAAKLGRERENCARLRAQAEARRGEEERQARIEAEKRADASRLEAERKAQTEREASERQARLAALSENAKEAEKLRAKCDNASKNKGKGSQLFAETKKLIEQAAEWSGEDKAELKAVAAYVFDWLGVKKDDTKKLLRGLDSA